MKLAQSPLSQIKIAAPCPADWNKMRGNERVRFCSECQLNVYNLSALTQQEATELITKTEGRLCVRFYQRKDGTVITTDCPIGYSLIKKRIARITNIFLAALFTLFSWTESFGKARIQSRKKSPQLSCQTKKPLRAKKRKSSVATIGVLAPAVYPTLAIPPANDAPLPSQLQSLPEPPPPPKNND